MLACVCRPMTTSLPKLSTSSTLQKAPPIVVTCEPRVRVGTSSLLTEIKVPGKASAAELRAMALQQQQQIEAQNQLLAAREQRLRFLRAQEIRGAAVAAEGERLRRLRERVQAQESKLRRLRALRGQADLQKSYNVTLSNDLDSIRALFSEKEKELSIAVAKVESLTKQLEEIKRDRRGPLHLLQTSAINNGGKSQHNASTAARELDKLRKELMYRNQLSLQQDARLHLQREALHQRQAELRSVDERIFELQTRLQKKKAAIINHQDQNKPLNIHDQQKKMYHVQQQQQQNQKPMYNSDLIQHQQHLTNNNNNNGNTKPIHNVSVNHRVMSKSNVAAVEPYIHNPQHSPINTATQTNQFYQKQMLQNMANLKLNTDANGNTEDLKMTYIATNENDETHLLVNKPQNKINSYIMKDATLANFSGKKLDPKYQTLPHNAKFASSNGGNNGGIPVAVTDYNISNNNNNSVNNNKQVLKENEGLLRANGIEEVTTLQTTHQSHQQQQQQPQNPHIIQPINLMQQQQNSHQQLTVHSMPLNTINKSVAVPVANGEVSNSLAENSEITGNDITDIKHRPPLLKDKNLAPKDNTIVSSRKPISSVAPTQISLVPKPVSVSSKVNMVAPSINSVPIVSHTEIEKTPALPPKPNKTPDTDATMYIQSNANGPNNLAATKINGNNSSGGPTLPPTVVNLVNKAMAGDAKTQTQIDYQFTMINPAQNHDNLPIKAKPLTIKKQPLSEQPRLRSLIPGIKTNQFVSRRIEMPPSFLFPETEKAPLKPDTSTMQTKSSPPATDETDKSSSPVTNEEETIVAPIQTAVKRAKSSLSEHGKTKLARRVSFDPLALLLDASLEGELELVQKTATQVANPSNANDEGITALHNAICAGHFDIVKFLVEYGCDVNAQDSDGWTPLHCAASCNNLSMVKFLVESGACIFASTLSDLETPAEKCEEDEEGFDGCSEYLYSIQEKLGIMNGGDVFAVFSYKSQQSDELSFEVNDSLTILRKGDDNEREWWWAKMKDCGNEGYVPRNLLGLYPRLKGQSQITSTTPTE